MGKWSKYQKMLAVFFLLTVPGVRPWIHADGRFYYAFARTILFQHNFDFALDWLHCYEANPRIADPATAYHEQFMPETGHYWNKWTIGPAILWAPFMIAARAITPLLDRLRGTHFANDGFSKPYMVAMSVGTLFYGFLALWFSFLFARKYVPERWAFLATVGIWLASSFTFYLYADPSYSHVHSAFLIALFVWLWDRTREKRSWWQWLAMGATAGLMLDTYYPNAFLLILPMMDAIQGCWLAARERSGDRFLRILAGNLLFAATAIVVFLPTLMVKKIIFGTYFSAGYREHWYWNSPAFFRVCFSSHGVFSWTPILILAVLGLCLLWNTNRLVSWVFLGTLLSFVYFIGCYEGWHAIQSFGNRFFVAFTVFFILGLATLLKEIDALRAGGRLSWPVLAGVTGLFILWNCGVMYQYAAHMFSQFGEVSWSEVVHNQVAVVPGQVAHLLWTTVEQGLRWK